MDQLISLQRLKPFFFLGGLNDPSAPYGACEGLYMVKVRIRGGAVVYGADWLCLG